MSRPASPFVFVVSDLLRRSGEERAERIEAVVDYGIELSRTSTEKPLVAEVTMRSIQGGVMVDGVAAFDAVHTCHRCLTKWTESLRVPIRQLVASGESDSDYRLDGDSIDLEPVVRDESALALPLVPTCREDCAGLCPKCGADLNTGACSGHDEEQASPFAGLRDLLETQE